MDWAFNLPRGAALAAKWRLIPDGIDVLVTHSPPHGILDEVARRLPFLAGVWESDTHVGCEELRTAVERLRPRLHVFGHIHEGYGRESRHGTDFVNASNCDRHYRPMNPPVVVDL
jgi:Icc-related predicted phosphoesterase